MENSLSGIASVVDDHAVSALIEVFPGSNGFRNEEKMSDKLSV
jgi:hypothetical protein